MEKSFPFSKNMHLCSKKEFEKLLNFGKKITSYPVKAIFLIEPLGFQEESDIQQKEGVEPVQIAISVPKKLFKRAVKRNRLKRLTREAFRLTYPQYAPYFNGVSLRILYVYIHHDVTTQMRMVESISHLFMQMLDFAKKGNLTADASSHKNL